MVPTVKKKKQSGRGFPFMHEINRRVYSTIEMCEEEAWMLWNGWFPSVGAGRHAGQLLPRLTNSVLAFMGFCRVSYCNLTCIRRPAGTTLPLPLLLLTMKLQYWHELTGPGLHPLHVYMQHTSVSASHSLGTGFQWRCSVRSTLAITKKFINPAWFIHTLALHRSTRPRPSIDWVDSGHRSIDRTLVSGWSGKRWVWIGAGCCGDILSGSTGISCFDWFGSVK